MIIEQHIKKMEEVPDKGEINVLLKIAELKRNKQTLENIYLQYQLKLKELSYLLDEYETAHQISRINLRKIQLWLKLTYSN